MFLQKMQKDFFHCLTTYQPLEDPCKYIIINFRDRNGHFPAQQLVVGSLSWLKDISITTLRLISKKNNLNALLKTVKRLTVGSNGWRYTWRLTLEIKSIFVHTKNARGHFMRKETWRPIWEYTLEKSLTTVIYPGAKNLSRPKDI